MKIELEPGYLLSSRPYLESSLLLDVFTKEHGRVSLVAKGVKRSKEAKFALLQPFMPLLLSWQGRGSLHTLIGVELNQSPNFLQAKQLISGMYVNELLVKLLAIGDPHADLFYFYQNLIKDLAKYSTASHTDATSDIQLQNLLRIFEKRLLIAIGYALPLSRNVITGEEVTSNNLYTFDLECGPAQTTANAPKEEHVFLGSSLLALEQETFHLL